MVTVRQFSRGVSQTIRAMERESRRLQHQRMLDDRAAARQSILDASAAAFDTHQELLGRLVDAHRITFQRRNWGELASQAAPEEPVYDDERERAAKLVFASYKPGWAAQAFGAAKKRQARLSSAIHKARAEDAEAHKQRLALAAQRSEEIIFAKALLALQPKAIVKALSEHTEFTDVAIEGVSVLAVESRVIAVIDALELEDMPTRSISMLQSGKVSEKVLSPAKIVELHRDNVCSSAIRVAAEFLKILPIDTIELVVKADLLDRSTGHITARPIFYSRFTAQLMASANLLLVDPALLTERLGARMDWNRRDGFCPIGLDGFDLPDELTMEHET